MANLLYEIGAEEIPASYIAPALAQLEAGVQAELDAVNLTHGEIRVTGTPRRLVLFVANIPERQEDKPIEVSGPPLKAAFDAAGNPTKAALGFAKSQGADVSEIERRETERGTYCVIRKNVEGRAALEVLAEILPRITLGLSFPKSMVWPGSGGKAFARPVRSLLALFGGEIVPFDLFGVRSGRSAEGHPILRPGFSDLAEADYDAYMKALRDRCVLVDIDERRKAIWRGINETIAGEKPPVGLGMTKDAQEALVDEVTHLVQWPSVSLGRFEEAFLEVPAAVIEAAMTEHQRYFPMESQGRLSPFFIVVSDRGETPADLIRVGNEQVLKARLADAQFFYREDSDRTLEADVAGLGGVAFLKGLGTYAEKTARLEKLAPVVARELGMDEATGRHAGRAARLCKADLLTAMVGEFPKLQGEVGRLYALRDGEPEEVADAVAEHYMPRSADGDLPATPAGQALSLAEKLDNLTSCFALGLVPTGSADPYALRRQAQGALRIIERGGRHLNILDLAREAQALLPEKVRSSEDAMPRLEAFLKDRLFTLAFARWTPPAHDLIMAVLNADAEFTDIVDFWKRLEALQETSSQSWWGRLVTAVERTHNITRDAEGLPAVRRELFAEDLETQLWTQLERHRTEIETLEKERKYAEASKVYADAFADLLHEFFEKVFVNVDDMGVRRNRLSLLKEINALYTARIADLSEIVTGVHR